MNLLFRLVFMKSDNKLYGSDAIQPICGVNAKQCTPYHMGDYLGLHVDQRPFNITFRYASAKVDHLKPRIFQQESDGSSRSIHPVIRPVMPVSHRCNESYSYGDYDYGAKCSCKV